MGKSWKTRTGSADLAGVPLQKSDQQHRIKKRSKQRTLGVVLGNTYDERKKGQ
jgi:hypothetical protein